MPSLTFGKVLKTHTTTRALQSYLRRMDQTLVCASSSSPYVSNTSILSKHQVFSSPWQPLSAMLAPSFRGIMNVILVRQIISRKPSVSETHDSKKESFGAKLPSNG